MGTPELLLRAVLGIVAVLVLYAAWRYAWSLTPEERKEDFQDTDLVP